MEVFITAVNKLIIIFLLVLIGCFAKKKDIIDDCFIDKFSGFLTKIVVPCFIISSMQLSYTPELLQKGIVVFVTCMIMHIWGMLVGFGTGKLFRVPHMNLGIWVFSCMFANIGFMGVPVISMIFGGNSVFYCAFATAAFNLASYTLGIWIIGRYGDGSHPVEISLRQLLKLPVNIAIIIGMILFIGNIQLPEAIGGTVKMVGDMIAPLAMIYIGAVLGRMRLKEMIYDRWAYVISINRLIVVPLTAYLMLRPFITDQLVLGVVIVGLSTPIGAYCAILAAQYGADEKTASRYIFISTALSILTMPFFFFLFI